MASQPKATPDESIWLGLKGSHYLLGCVFGFVGMETSEEAEEGFVIFSCPSAEPGLRRLLGMDGQGMGVSEQGVYQWA